MNDQTQLPEEGQSNVLAEAMEETKPTTEEITTASDYDLEQFHQRIAELEGQVKDAKEGQARANAEAYNAQKRIEQEAEKSKKFALQKFAKDLLEVVDNLERAIANTDENNPALEGVKLTHKSLINLLEKNGIQTVDPQGEKFNAELHEAVGIDPNAEPDTVGEVLQKGYTLHDRLLRPAMVKVGG